jgi:adenylate cyclase
MPNDFQTVLSPSKISSRQRIPYLSAIERRLAAIMFTDMVGYTALSQKNESLAMELLEEHRALIRPLFQRYNGKEVKTIGDSFLVEFASALEALRCASDIQRLIHERNLGLAAERRVLLRIGIHVGDVIHSSNDVYGDAVNVASRIEPIASPEGICITHQVYDNVRNKFELPLSSLGKKELKNIGETIEVYRVILPWEVKGSLSEFNLDTKRLAVLPFSNISPDPNDDFFADGMTEELISTTSAIEGLTVIARTSVMRYKNKDKSVAEIGRELNVGTVLEGSVRKAGKNLRITVQLIDVKTEGHLWAQKFDRELEDIFQVQTEVAKEVAGHLELKLLPRGQRLIESRSTQNSDAYAYFLKGRYLWNERTEDAMKKAIEYFERAAEKDPTYAQAYSGLSDCYAILVNYGLMTSDEGLVKAKLYATRALEIDEALATAHASLAGILWSEWNFKLCGRELRRALELNPNLAIAHQWYGHYLALIERRIEEALKEKMISRELDPFSALANINVGWIYSITGQYEKALELYRNALEIFPDYWNLYDHFGFTLVLLGRYDEGIAAIEKALSLSGGFYQVKSNLAAGLALSGRNEEARKILSELEALAGRQFVTPEVFSSIYACLGEKDQAFQYLERAFEQKSALLPEILLGDPMLRGRLGLDPRFKSLSERFASRGGFELVPAENFV